ncbi:probable endochitinase [Thrips palmi]|uniref:Probable endochitinase n=1 Tax=Thrips palmi TaxID=161013 RepID=A0A6P8ZAA0_THRPL|nr:probable endochitinase [Thrips palmi]
MARLLLFVCLTAAAFSMTIAAGLAPATTAAPTAAPTTVNPRCQPACPKKKAGKVPNLCRCQAYFECDKKGQATPKLCMAWQNFDPQALECTFWDRVDCNWLTTAPPTTTTTTTPAPPTTTRGPPVPGCDWRPQCPASGSSKQGIPCKDSCGSYIECKDGDWAKKKCGILQPKFDTKSNKCVMWGAKCAA